MYFYDNMALNYFRTRNITDECCREIRNTHLMFNYFFSENLVVYEIMWKSVVQPDRPQMTI